MMPAKYISSPRFDNLLIIYSPVLALLVAGLVFIPAELVSGFNSDQAPGWTLDLRADATGVLIGILIQAHLVLVLVRSHLNSEIFRKFRKRLILVPIALILIQMVSLWMIVAVFVLTVFWDVYHSGMQTFGFGRIYDMKAGNDPEQVRRVDIVFNLIVYIAPILAGLSLMDHLASFWKFSEVGSAHLAIVPLLVSPYVPEIRIVGSVVCLVGIGGCLLAYRRYIANGYRLPKTKKHLYLSTSLATITAWSYLPPLYAFFVVNLYHAVQYFAIVWWSERERLLKLMRVENLKWGSAVALAIILITTLGYGYVSENTSEGFGIVLINTITIMHFWGDGFIWSVRKGQVA